MGNKSQERANQLFIQVHSNNFNKCNITFTISQTGKTDDLCLLQRGQHEKVAPTWKQLQIDDKTLKNIEKAVG